MNWEKLCPNLSFTFEREIRNLRREKLCPNLGSVLKVRHVIYKNAAHISNLT